MLGAPIPDAPLRYEGPVRRAAHLDSTHRPIVDALRQIGATVESLAGVGKGCPDLLVGYHGVTLLVEVKSPKAIRKMKTELDESQVRWLDDWHGSPVLIARSVEEAVQGVLAACAP
jgi:Holliday junction resolvase